MDKLRGFFFSGFLLYLTFRSSLLLASKIIKIMQCFFFICRSLSMGASRIAPCPKTKCFHKSLFGSQFLMGEKPAHSGQQLAIFLPKRFPNCFSLFFKVTSMLLFLFSLTILRVLFILEACEKWIIVLGAHMLSGRIWFNLSSRGKVWGHNSIQETSSYGLLGL